MTDPDVDTQPFVVLLTYRVQAKDRSEAMELLIKYQSDAQFMIEQDLRKHRGSQVVDLLDCAVRSAAEPQGEQRADRLGVLEWWSKESQRDSQEQRQAPDARRVPRGRVCQGRSSLRMVQLAGR